MSFLGVGPLEIILVLIIALVVVGPHDLVNFARKAGAWLRKVRRTEAWQGMMQTSWELQRLRERLWEETGLHDIQRRPPETSGWHPGTPWLSPNPNGQPLADMHPPSETSPKAAPPAASAEASAFTTENGAPQTQGARGTTPPEDLSDSPPPKPSDRP